MQVCFKPHACALRHIARQCEVRRLFLKPSIWRSHRCRGLSTRTATDQADTHDKDESKMVQLADVMEDTDISLREADISTPVDAPNPGLTTKRPRGRPRKSPSVQLPAAATAGSEKHHDLASFVSYAERVELDKASTVYVGTHYEYTVSAALRRFRLELTRTGGKSDLGVDLLGFWNIPDAPKPIPILLQCKCTAEKPGPSMIRELNGAFEGAPAMFRGEGVMALLVASKEATKGVRDAMSRSIRPMGFLNISTEGVVHQFLWNARAAQLGLGGLGATLRHKLRVGQPPIQEIVLTWMGRPWLK